jgi:hypothetical protein
MLLMINLNTKYLNKALMLTTPHVIGFLDLSDFEDFSKYRRPFSISLASDAALKAVTEAILPN